MVIFSCRIQFFSFAKVRISLNCYPRILEAANCITAECDSETGVTFVLNYNLVSYKNSRAFARYSLKGMIKCGNMNYILKLLRKLVQTELMRTTFISTNQNINSKLAVQSLSFTFVSWQVVSFVYSIANQNHLQDFMKVFLKLIYFYATIE